jgi:hypothetical protein
MDFIVTGSRPEWLAIISLSEYFSGSLAWQWDWKGIKADKKFIDKTGKCNKEDEMLGIEVIKV